MKYILASASPRRKELLELAGFQFEVIPSFIEEKISKTLAPHELVMELALEKANDVFCKHGQKDCVVIGADTIVVYRDEILGKPADKAEAYDMLSMLADRTHQVYTGVALVISKKGQVHTNTFYESTDVTFCLDKAGAYGIQGSFAIHVKCIHGDYNNVVGLPVSRLYQELLTEYASPLSEP